MNLVGYDLPFVVAGLEHLPEGLPFPLQCLFGLLASRDVLDQGNNMVNRSVVLAKRTGMDRGVDDAPILLQ